MTAATPAPLDGLIHDRIRGGHRPSHEVLTAVASGQAARLGVVGAQRVARQLSDDLVGLGSLGPLVADDAVTDVTVNGDGTVWVDRGGGLARAPEADLAGAEAARRLAVRLAGLAGRRLDDAQPWVDGLLPGGVRLHAILPPVVAGGAHISLRVPRRTSPSLAELTAWGMVSPGQAAALGELIADRVAFVVSGGTGSGKTTLLSAMLAELPTADRLLVVEDVRELRIAHQHTVYLQSRPANVEGAGAVTMVDLVRQALRMRPDRVVVGEVRGAEVRDLLMALNTGHEGGCGTVHANSAVDVLPRLEALGALAGMTPEAVQAQVRSALDAVIHVRRGPGGARVVESITHLDGRPW